MLYLCWLLFQGAWQQTASTGHTSAVMEASMGYFYLGRGVLRARPLFILERPVEAGHRPLAEADLVIGITESEDEVQLQQIRRPTASHATRK
jgi:hypothetical protein